MYVFSRLFFVLFFCFHSGIFSSETQTITQAITSDIKTIKKIERRQGRTGDLFTISQIMDRSQNFLDDLAKYHDNLEKEKQAVTQSMQENLANEVHCQQQQNLAAIQEVSLSQVDEMLDNWVENSSSIPLIYHSALSDLNSYKQQLQSLSSLSVCEQEELLARWYNVHKFYQNQKQHNSLFDFKSFLQVEMFRRKAILADIIKEDQYHFLMKYWFCYQQQLQDKIMKDGQYLNMLDNMFDQVKRDQIHCQKNYETMKNRRDSIIKAAIDVKSFAQEIVDTLILSRVNRCIDKQEEEKYFRGFDTSANKSVADQFFELNYEKVAYEKAAIKIESLVRKLLAQKKVDALRIDISKYKKLAAHLKKTEEAVQFLQKQAQRVEKTIDVQEFLEKRILSKVDRQIDRIEKQKQKEENLVINNLKAEERRRKNQERKEEAEKIRQEERLMKLDLKKLEEENELMAYEDQLAFNLRKFEQEKKEIAEEQKIEHQESFDVNNLKLAFSDDILQGQDVSIENLKSQELEESFYDGIMSYSQFVQKMEEIKKNRDKLEKQLLKKEKKIEKVFSQLSVYDQKYKHASEALRLLKWYKDIICLDTFDENQERILIQCIQEIKRYNQEISLHGLCINYFLLYFPDIEQQVFDRLQQIQINIEQDRDQVVQYNNAIHNKLFLEKAIENSKRGILQSDIAIQEWKSLYDLEKNEKLKEQYKENYRHALQYKIVMQRKKKDEEIELSKYNQDLGSLDSFGRKNRICALMQDIQTDFKELDSKNIDKESNFKLTKIGQAAINEHFDLLQNQLQSVCQNINDLKSDAEKIDEIFNEVIQNSIGLNSYVKAKMMKRAVYEILHRKIEIAHEDACVLTSEFISNAFQIKASLNSNVNEWNKSYFMFMLYHKMKDVVRKKNALYVQAQINDLVRVQLKIIDILSKC